MKDSFKDLTQEELLNKQEELRKKYLKLRMDAVIGHIDNPLEKRTLRRKLSRINTIVREYELGIRK
jgi:large subunit ribosomal protein L29